jgi:hypothetical protein
MEYRETFYECIFTLQGEDCRLVVHAWDAEGAARQVVSELESAGLSTPAGLSVRRLALGQPDKDAERFE